MMILEDTRNKVGLHSLKNAYFQRMGIEVCRTKLFVGDYTLPTNQSICIDTKESITELISDICGKQHERFRNECIRAKDAGISLIILVEDDGGYVDKKQTIYNDPVKSVDDLHGWKNPRLFIRRNGKQIYPTATRGITLQKACKTMTAKYGTEFYFCRSFESGKRILELLGVIASEI